jgi:hypothetical protein
MWPNQAFIAGDTHRTEGGWSGSKEPCGFPAPNSMGEIESNITMLIAIYPQPFVLFQFQGQDCRPP